MKKLIITILCLTSIETASAQQISVTNSSNAELASLKAQIEVLKNQLGTIAQGAEAANQKAAEAMKAANEAKEDAQNAENLATSAGNTASNGLKRISYIENCAISQSGIVSNTSGSCKQAAGTVTTPAASGCAAGQKGHCYIGYNVDGGTSSGTCSGQVGRTIYHGTCSYKCNNGTWNLTKSCGTKQEHK